MRVSRLSEQDIGPAGMEVGRGADGHQYSSYIRTHAYTHTHTFKKCILLFK